MSANKLTAVSSRMRETLRVWLESTETYGLEVLLEKRQGKIAQVVREFLHVMSRVYGRIIKARRFLYHLRTLQVNEPFGKRKYSFWKVLLFVIIISALAGIILAFLIPTFSH
jgi:hypothetical protein